jgi:hypothetical protein
MPINFQNPYSYLSGAGAQAGSALGNELAEALFGDRPMALHINEFTGSIGTPARTYLWDLAIPSLADLGSIRAQTAQFPSVGSTDVELFYQGHPIKFAGAIEYEQTWTVTIAESENGDVYNALYDWRTKISNQADNIQGAPGDYKENITVKALKSTDGAPWLQAMLYGCYVKTIDAIDLDRSANTEAWKWSVTFSFDYWTKL